MLEKVKSSRSDLDDFSRSQTCPSESPDVSLGLAESAESCAFIASSSCSLLRSSVRKDLFSFSRRVVYAKGKCESIVSGHVY